MGAFIARAFTARIFFARIFIARIFIARIFIAILCPGLLVASEPAGAQTTYEFSVSRHSSVTISERQVDDILAKASDMLQRRAACNITFKRTGPIHTFTAPNAAGDIRTVSDRDAVHKENFDRNVINIKILNEIGSCRPVPGVDSFDGCSFPHEFRSIIVRGDLDHPELVWPHEFGHQTGLFHRKGDTRKTLMSPCPLVSSNVELNSDECACFKSGPGTCETAEPASPAQCPAH
jgi:hypothetical protein